MSICLVNLKLYKLAPVLKHFISILYDIISCWHETLIYLYNACKITFTMKPSYRWKEQERDSTQGRHQLSH
jgi:hypothetical protein